MISRLDPTTIADEASVLVENIALERGVIESYKGLKDTDIDAELPSIYNFKGNWSNSKVGTVYAKLLGILYKTDDTGNMQKSINGTDWWNMFVAQPPQLKVEVGATLSTPASESSVGFYGTNIQYQATYYNSQDGYESPPSAITVAVQVGEEKSTTGNDSNIVWYPGTTNITVQASSDPQIDTIRIYRSGASVTSPRLVFEVENKTQTIKDETPDANVGSTTISTSGYQELPKFKYICSYYSFLFGGNIVAGSKINGQKAYTNMVYYSDESNPLLWNPLNYIVFDDDIVGMFGMSSGILIFSEHRTYIITGNSADTFSLYLLFDDIGCISPNSIQSYKMGCVWQSAQGFMYFNQDITNLTLVKIDPYTVGCIDACVCLDVYYAVFSDHILIIDFRLENAVSKLDIKTEGIETLFGSVYCHNPKTNKIAVLGQGDLMDMHWISKKYSEDYFTNLKNYDKLYMQIEGNLHLKIYIDSNLAFDEDLKDGFNQIKVAQKYRHGYAIQFEVTGTGKILEICSSPEDRQDGN